MPEPGLKQATDIEFGLFCDVAIIGAGAAGLIAALRAREAGADVVVLERDSLPRGSTALSAGLIPAAGTRFQRELCIVDNPALFAADILTKADHEPDGNCVDTVTQSIGQALEWLADTHKFNFSVIENFTYPGHSAQRMHGLPTRSGIELMDRLRESATGSGIDVITNATVINLFVDSHNCIKGVEILRPDGSFERLGCKALILACNGFGGNKSLVQKHVRNMSHAHYFGHPGNQGEAIIWGEKMGAAIRHLSACQGHGSVAHPHGILITWATMSEGGFQINANGDRFSDESHGYSEQAAIVLAQPGAVVWSVFDERIAAIARQFEDFRNAEASGAILSAHDTASLARLMKMPEETCAASILAVKNFKENFAADEFGRNWSGVAQLRPPYRAVKVTGALFHTQGGLVVNEEARVLNTHHQPMPNLFAAGGAACGVSGSGLHGYLSGNGLLTAIAYGFIAGDRAAKLP